jgi:hypothetical protein
MKTNIPFKDDQFECDFYYENTKPVDILKVPTKGCSVIALLQCSGIWVAGSKFGLSWKVSQLVYKPRKTLEKFGFIGISDTSSTPASQDVEVDVDDLKISSEEAETASVDSDSDGDSEDEVEEVVKEVVKEAPRRGRKKIA